MIVKHPSVLLEAHLLNQPHMGLGVFAFDLVKALSKANTRFRLLVNAHSPDVMRHFPNPLTEFHQYTGLQRGKAYWLFKRPNVWHCLAQNLKVEPVWCGKYVLTIHDVIQRDLPKYRKRLTDKIRRADAITYISEFVKAETHRYFDVPSGVQEYVIYNGNSSSERLNFSDFQPIEGAKRPFFYAVGDFQERKNFHSLIAMMRLLPDFNLIISGNCATSYGELVRSLIEDSGLTNRVFLTGFVPNEGKQYYLHHATAFIQASTEEGFGLPIVEAMSFGKPVFLSPLSCMPEIGGEHAYYFPDFDAEAMKQTIVSGLHHFSENRPLMEARMRERAGFFSWDRAAQQYLEAYEAVLR